MSADAYEFFGALDMGVYALNVSTIYKPSNILNMLFGVRYLHAYNGDVPGEELFVDLAETVDTVSVYENRYCLPIAFAASRDALSFNVGALSGRLQQAGMLRSLLGDEPGDFYTSEETLANACARLSAGGIELSEFSNDRIAGRVVCGEDSFLYTSIPADEGWRVFVDGERVETVTVFDYLLGVPMDAGEHTVELRYTAPGFRAGLALSIASALLVLTYILYDHKKRYGTWPLLSKIKNKRESR